MAQGGFNFMGTGVEFYDPGMSFIEGSVNQYFDKKSEKRAFERQLQLMAAQYNYAQRYAENSPSWNIKGLRDAGLNPILAVSNGANLGSTIPSAPTSASHKPTPSSSRGGFTYDPLTRSQLDVNAATIRNLDAQAEAASVNSMSQAKERDANIILRTLEAEQRKTANFSSPLVRDAETLVRRLFDTVKDYSKLIPDFMSNISSSFINNTPSKPLQDRTSEARSKFYEKAVDSEWKTGKTIDGKPVYRKRGDIGGIMHMYR